MEQIKICRACRTGADGSGGTLEIELIRECIFTIEIDGQKTGQVSATPADLERLAAGWALSEGWVNDAGRVGDIAISEEEQILRVSRRAEGPGAASETEGPGAVSEPDGSCAASAGAGGSACGLGWSPEEMAEIFERFLVDPPLHAATGAAHSCMIVRRGDDGELQILYRSEDAGRHSALDKAIGWAALEGAGLGDCLLMTSGRISTRMAQKAVRAGAGALAGKGAVTAEAVETAGRAGMTLYGYVNGEGAVQFAPEPKGIG